LPRLLLRFPAHVSRINNQKRRPGAIARLWAIKREEEEGKLHKKAFSSSIIPQNAEAAKEVAGARNTTRLSA
jgi:hypothetical protein